MTLISSYHFHIRIHRLISSGTVLYTNSLAPSIAVEHMLGKPTYDVERKMSGIVEEEEQNQSQLDLRTLNICSQFSHL